LAHSWTIANSTRRGFQLTRTPDILASNKPGLLTLSASVPVVAFFFYPITRMRYVGRTMTALDDIKELDRENSAFNRKLLGALLEEHQERIEEKIATLRDTLLDAPGQIIAFYKTTDLLTRRMSTKDAVAVWKKTRRTLLLLSPAMTNRKTSNSLGVSFAVADKANLLSGSGKVFSALGSASWRSTYRAPEYKYCRAHERGTDKDVRMVRGDRLAQLLQRPSCRRIRRVTFQWRRRREACSMITKMYRTRNLAVTATQKSQATMAAA
jgi:hypothetical protein